LSKKPYAKAAHRVETGHTEGDREAVNAFVEKRAPFLPAGEPESHITSGP